jgi:hypothetical protein
MDGPVEQNEEEVRPKRGKSIRLPEDTDLEAQRYILIEFIKKQIRIIYFYESSQDSSIFRE